YRKSCFLGSFGTRCPHFTRLKHVKRGSTTTRQIRCTCFLNAIDGTANGSRRPSVSVPICTKYLPSGLIVIQPRLRIFQDKCDWRFKVLVELEITASSTPEKHLVLLNIESNKHSIRAQLKGLAQWA